MKKRAIAILAGILLAVGVVGAIPTSANATDPSLYVVHTSFSMAAGNQTGHTALCDEGDLATGGGYATQKELTVYSSKPSGGVPYYSTGWRAAAKNNDTVAHNLNVFAVCLDLGTPHS